MEFLMGRALGNNLLNLMAYDQVREALEELGFDLNAIEDQEPDPALGNGGLGDGSYRQRVDHRPAADLQAEGLRR